MPGSHPMQEYSTRISAIEYRPAEVVAQALIVQDKITNRTGQLIALPAALEKPGMFAPAFGRSRAGCLDGVGGSAELVRGDVGNRGGLTGSKGGMPRCPGQIPGSRHGVSSRCTRLGHRYLAAYPEADLLNSITRP